MILLYLLLLYYLGLVVFGSFILFVIFKLPVLVKYYLRYVNESSGFVFVYGGNEFKNMIAEKEQQWKRFKKMTKIVKKNFNGKVFYVNNEEGRYWSILYGYSDIAPTYVSQGPVIPYPSDDITPKEFEDLILLMYKL